MKRIILIISFVCLIHGTLLAKDDKGHPFWWGQLQSADMVAIANISYDPKFYFTIESSPNGEIIGPIYYIDGKVKLKKIIYINKYSRFIEDYTHYFKNPSVEAKILIPAKRVNPLSLKSFDGGKNDSIVLKPSSEWGAPIDSQDILVGLNQCFIFPIWHLVLDSVVPDGQKDEMIKLINKRHNNYIESK
ncbi:MAG: hypothetical protein WCY23_03960 [Candidatus Omnitrophota bacterium]